MGIPLAFTLFVFGMNASANITPLDYRTSRYEGVIGQTDWYTCGPAAIATLLQQYYEVDTGEAEMLEISLKFSKEPERALLEGLSAAALKLAMQSKGLSVQGYLLTIDSLVDYFERGGLPVILHVTSPRNHYVVGVGISDAQIVLEDPSWGRRILGFDELNTEKGFSGVALVPLPAADMATLAKRRQRGVLNEVADQQARLTNLRMRFQ